MAASEDVLIDVFIFDTVGQVQTRFGYYNGSVSWYHDLVIDKDENIYVGDILNNTIQKFKKVSSR
jgi:peptidylamidoglycolate lyase